MDKDKIPSHIAIIMDGNRRWAAKAGLGAVAGHENAAKKAIEPIVERAIELGIPYLTFWAFSTENWKRDESELKGLMNIFRDALKTKLDRLAEKKVKIKYLGNLDKFPEDISARVKEMVEKTKDNTAITVTFALNYGGRDEIIRAVKKMIQEKIDPEIICEEKFSTYLDTVGVPDPDLIVRTGGEQRLSGYLPWQSVYSELYFTPVLFPDFSPEEFDKAIIDFQGRSRRFGGGKFKSYKK